MTVLTLTKEGIWLTGSDFQLYLKNLLSEKRSFEFKPSWVSSQKLYSKEAVHKGIAENWPPLPCSKNVRTGSTPLVRADTSSFRKILCVLHQKLRMSTSEDPPLPLSAKCSQWTTPPPPDCGRLLWRALNNQTAA